MRAILTCAKNSTIALKMRKNARNSEIYLITKIVVTILFVCFNKSRIRWIKTRRITKVVIIMIRKNILLKIVLSLNKRIFKLTLWKAFDRTFTKTNKKTFFRNLSLKFWMIRKIKWIRDNCRRNRESQTKILKCIRKTKCLSKKQMK